MWNGKWGKWIEGSFVDTYEAYSHKQRCFITDDDYDDHEEIEVIPETVGQFTGLTDKNGTKIFEGDIVNCFSSDIVGNPKISKILVKNMTDYNTMVYLNISNELEVIGNIHDNPKLLKGETE